jgi:AraC-like DNA-binding protein
MPDGGSSMFTHAGGYQSQLQDIIDLLVPQPRDFCARLTWLDLAELRLLRARETTPRVGFMRLPADLVFVIFPTRKDSVLVYGEATLRFGDIMVHAPGERRHQRTTAPCEWAAAALTPATLRAFGRTLAGQALAAPRAGRIMRPPRAESRQLLRLHAQAGRVAEKHLDRVANPEVARALEQELMLSLMGCLAFGMAQDSTRGSQRMTAILMSFEALLTAHPSRLLRTRDICSALNVSEVTLRAACAQGLGMSPGHYQRLRRLRLARAALLRDKPATDGTIQQTLQCWGFTNLHRFVMEYWRFFGEMPPVPPRDAASG